MRQLFYLALTLFTFASCSKKQEELKSTSMTRPVKNVSISINSSKEQVYQFASNPENFPRWLAFVKSVSRKSENVWNAETTIGQIEIQFVPANEFGIIDHLVKLQDGTEVSNPLRVIGNDKGSEVIFTLFQMPGKTERDIEEDAGLVEADLATLKRILENNRPGL